MDNPVLIPKSGQSAKDFLRNKRGTLVLLNVRCEGKQTSVVINIESRTSATWRWIDRKNKGVAGLNLDWPGFDLTDESIVLQDTALNFLAANFPTIHEICAGSGENAPSEFLVGGVAMAPAHMDELLRRLEAKSDVFRKLGKEYAAGAHTPYVNV